MPLYISELAQQAQYQAETQTAFHPEGCEAHYHPSPFQSYNQRHPDKLNFLKGMQCLSSSHLEHTRQTLKKTEEYMYIEVQIMRML